MTTVGLLILPIQGKAVTLSPKRSLLGPCRPGRAVKATSYDEQERHAGRLRAMPCRDMHHSLQHLRLS
eukprot:31524-Eustigmatos_ZCMA.PRE.1